MINGKWIAELELPIPGISVGLFNLNVGKYELKNKCLTENSKRSHHL
jgi:hypothetical protein